MTVIRVKCLSISISHQSITLKISLKFQLTKEIDLVLLITLGEIR